MCVMVYVSYRHLQINVLEGLGVLLLENVFGYSQVGHTIMKWKKVIFLR